MDAMSEHVAESLGDEAYTGEYNDKEKAKVRKSGPSLIRKTIELAQKGRVLAVMVYWDPTHRCYRVAAQLPDGESVPDLNRLVAEALVGRLPEPKAQRKRVLARRGPKTSRADQRRGKMQPSRPPLRRSARTRHARRIEPVSDDIYTFRGASEEVPEAEIISGSDRGSDSGSDGSDNGSDGSDNGSDGSDNGSDRSGSRSASRGGCDIVPDSLFGSIHRSPLSPDGNAAVQDRTGCIVTVGGTAGCPPPASVDGPAAEGHAAESGQPNATVNFGSGPLVNGFGAYTVANQEAALPSVGIARQDGVSSAAATQQSWQPVASGASQPWSGIQAAVALPGGLADLMSTTQRHTSSVYSDAFDLTELTETISHEEWEQQADAVAALESEVLQLRRDLRRLRFMADRGQRALHEMANLVMSISRMLAAVRNQCKIEGRKRLANFAVL
ncbi:hypothetical protein IF1G_10805 [Cordyceps javanica]|uniref:Uncharacterized protein n=1 Tax=Cordyceps javanica TaxID=43265 RepID=A0A545VJG2_9HYPO|nr:hypothetical protein IF1G_10805 [Cordyceps javanica]TQW01862.1 hypothetical protein IF2G_10575 [Cordyceps javanica]